MNNIDRILNFIDEEQTEAQTEQQAPEAQQQQEQAQQQEQQQQQQPMQTNNNINEITGEYTNNNNYDYTRDDKQYKSVLRKLNNNYKKSRYPCVIELGGEGNANMIFNDANELQTYINNIKNERRKVIKENKQKQINEYVNKNKGNLKRVKAKEYIKNDDELSSDSEEQKRIYKKGPLKAIQHEEDIIEVPRTSKKDRKTLINNLRKNPEQLKQLVTTVDDDDFNNKTKDIFTHNEELNKIYNIHCDNPFNKDITWTRDSFLKAMDDMIYEHEKQKQEAKKRLREDTEIRRQKQTNNIYNNYVSSSGINPDLMKRY